MRRRIRLTGRRQLPRSAVALRTHDLPDGRKTVSLSILDASPFAKFPGDARIRVRLTENKVSETLEFGPISSPKTAVDLVVRSFVKPSCQLRVIDSSEEKRGLVLGSASGLAIGMDGRDPGDQSREGILLFLSKNIAPRTWKLEIREDEHPLVFLDSKIPNAGTWARNDPVFIAAVLPAIVQQVFEDILEQPSPRDVSWMKDWLQWADSIMPGKELPSASDRTAQQVWIGDLLDSFADKHALLGRLVRHVSAGAEDA